jgi:hypothetical protein
MSTETKRTKWTKERVTEVAQGFKNRSVFHKQEQSAYQAARRLGVLEEICAHMTVEKRGRKAKEVETKAPQVSEQEVTVC